MSTQTESIRLRHFTIRLDSHGVDLHYRESRSALGNCFSLHVLPFLPPAFAISVSCLAKAQLRREDGVTSYLLFRFIPKFVCLLSKSIFTQASFFSRPSIALWPWEECMEYISLYGFTVMQFTCPNWNLRKTFPWKRYFVANNFYGKCNLKNSLAKQSLIFLYVPLDYRRTYHRKSNRQLL